MKCQKQPIRIAAAFILFVLLVATFLPLSAQTTVRRVTTAGDSAADGSTWAAAMTLKAALAASDSLDQVWTAAGTYKPDATNQNATFTIPAGVLVYGGFGSDENTFMPDDPLTPENEDTRDRNAEGALMHVTILSGDLADNDLTDREDANYTLRRTDNSYTVVTVSGANVTLNGLTIEGGERGTEVTRFGTTSHQGAGLFAGVGTTGTTLTACTFNNNSADDNGGGACFYGAATLTDCTFNNNSADDSGGAYFDGAATLTDCTFNNNSADDSGGGAYFDGAATLTGCDFNDNNSDYGGGGAFFRGTATVTNCTFTENTANGGFSQGGGAYFGGTTTVTQCTFTDNEAEVGGGASFFGTATLANCVFANNSSAVGGGLFFSDITSTVINSTFYNNTAAERGGGIVVLSSRSPDPLNLQNSILIGNTATTAGNAIYLAHTGTTTNIEATIDRNLIGGGMADLGVGLFDLPTETFADGLFADATNVALTNTVEESDATVVFVSTAVKDANYLRLAAGSPAVNLGNNLYLNNGTPGETDDDIKTDAADNARIQGGTVDLGAYESAFAAVAPTAQTLTFDDPTGGVTVRVGQSIDLVATTDAPSDAMLAITFTSSATNIAVVENDGDGTFSLRFDGAGDVTITATQAGDIGADGVNYAMATDTQTITVEAALPTGTTIRRVTTTGTGDGSSWVQAMSLQAALAASDSLDQVWTAAGTYKPDATNQNATFTIPAGVLVYGGFGSDENTFMPDDPLTPENEDTRDRNAEGALMHVTILSGDLADNDLTDREDANYALRRTDNSYTVVTVSGANVTLNGLTIEGGERGTEVTNLGTTSHHGAGLFAGVGTTGTTLTACTFNNNSANRNGGGAYFYGAATLTDCTFTDNETTGAFGDGGGAYFNATATLTGCDFNNNNANTGGGAYFGAATLTNCNFTGNVANRNGGGAYFYEADTLTDCTFNNNNAIDDGGGAFFYGAATLTDCTFNNNNAIDDGGGAYFGGVSTVINSTLYNNNADSRGGGLYVTSLGFPFTLQNSILIGNTATDVASGHQVYVYNTVALNVVNINYNLIAGGADPLGTDQGIRYRTSGSANVTETGTVDESDATVVFASIMAENANYLRLAAGSPAVNAGNNLYLNNGTPDDTNDDIKIDAAGNARIQNRRVDLGAYESTLDAPPTQAITFADPTGGVGVRVGQSIDLVATTNALDLFVTFTTDPLGIATLLDDGTGDGMGRLRFDAIGAVTVTAVQAGGDSEGVTYPPTTSVTYTITVRPAGATIFRVAETATGIENGSSWANAMTLQAALGIAIVAGDQIWIAAGTYTPHADDRAATFTIPAGVLVYGGFDPVADASDTDASSRSGTATILSGDLSDDDLTDRKDANYTLRRTDNSRTVVTIGGANVTLNGLTIEGGERGTAVTNFETSHGAGLFAWVGTTGTTLTACTFNNNSADNDGGGAYFDRAATLTDCTFNNNNADDDGGGAYFDRAATLTDCTFNNNSADDDGGGAYFDRAATLTDCTFNNNSADDDGGGAFFRGTATVTNCTFTENTANGQFSDGGGAFFRGVSTVINSTLYNNSADSRGGGLYVTSFAFPFILQNSILIGNTATDVASGDQVNVTNTRTTRVVNIQNNLIAGGADPLGTDQGVVYSTSGSANITEANTMDESDATVVFASIMAENANYLRLAAGSPAVNVGNNLYLNNGTPGETDDDIKTDAAGNARIQGGTVDLGAYESAFAAVAPTAQTLTFDDPTGGATVRVGQSIDLVATTDAPSDAMLAITFTSSATNIAVVENDGDGTFSLRFDAVGDITITATQAGGIGANGVTYAMATDTQTITVEAALPTGTTIRRVTTTGTGDGSSWVQAMSLQAALAASDSLDQVWTAAGTYKPDATNQNATFTIPAGVLVYGGFGSDENTFMPDDPLTPENEDTRDRNAEGALMHVTILSGDLADDDLTDREDANYALRRTENSYTVVTVSGANVTLNGLTIEGGERGTEVTNFGTSHHGAGLFAGVGTTGTTLTACTFNNNSADDDGGGAYFDGAATLTGCDFNNNSADDDGGGAFFRGTATVTNCTFTENTANGGLSDGGGGAFFGGTATVTNCTFTDNETTNNGGGAYFGGVSTVINSTLYNNNADSRGGGLYVTNRGFPFILRNSILIGNTAAGAAFGHQIRVFNTDAADIVNIQNNLIAGGADPLGTDQGVAYGTSGSANITEANTMDESDATVVFASIMAENANYLRLAAGSPAVNAGNNLYLNNGTPDDTNDDIKIDAAGNARIQNRRVDLGAYESTLDAPPTQAITFADPTGGVGVRVGQSIDLVATTNAPDLFVTFTTDPPGIATLLDDGTGDGMGRLRFDAIGVVTVTAVQAGGDSEGVTYPPATSVTYTITVRPVGATIFRVAETATGIENGSSWANAMTLQAALGIAIVAGDQIWIAAGTYTPHADDRAATFTIPAGVLVYGGFDPVADASDTDASSRSGAATILSGDLLGDDIARPEATEDQTTYDASRDDNSYTVVTIGGANVTLNGLTIEGGERGTEVTNFGTRHHGAGLFAGVGTTGTTLTACTFNNNSADDNGGGAYFDGAATLTDCTFNNNSADDDGGGAYFDGAATLTDCTFNNNSADDDGGGAYFDGAATLTDCTFNNNSADDDGGGAYFDGAATLTDCTFNNNSANGGFSQGGGAFFRGTATLTGCTFTDNEANRSGGGASFFGTATLANCVFANNSSAVVGGGLFFSDITGTVINSTFYNNTAAERGGGIVVLSSRLPDPLNLQNSILIGNTATTAGNAIYLAHTSTTTNIEATIDRNLIGGGMADLGVGLFDLPTRTFADHLFVDATNVALTNTVEESDATVVFASIMAENANYLRLAAGSPTVNAGNNLYLNNGTPGETDDDIKIDAAGNARIQGGTVDLGAYESAFAAVAPTAQTLTFDDPTGGVTARVGQSIDLVATTDAPSDAMLTITFTSSATNIAVVENDGDGTFSLRFDGAGDVTITATQAGGIGADGVNYAMATDTQTITVEAALPTGTTIRRVTTTGTGDGSSWAQAMSLQAALAASNEAGNQIWIAEGTYKPHADDRATTFTIPAGVLVYGGFDPVADASDTDASSRSGAATILSGDLLGDDIARPEATEDQTTYDASRDDNSYTVVTIGGANVTLNGLTIEGGERGTEVTNFGTSHHGAGLFAGVGTTGTTLTACTFNNNSADNDGGGAYFFEAATLTDCTFNNNSADDDGGGAYFDGAATLTDCTFNNNSADDDGGGAYFDGATTLTDCTFNNNSADDDGGGAYFDGAATLTNCNFTGNVTNRNGGGAYFYEAATLTACTFSENTTNGIFSRGGGAFFFAQATLINCTFNNNSADEDSGGAYFFEAATLTNCTFTDNEAKFSGGGANFGGTATLTNCTFTGNEAKFSGGGAYFYEAATLTDCTFTDNETTGAFGDGGGAYFGGTATLTNCTFTGNRARNGGGAYFEAGTTLTNCTFNNNSVGGNGGGGGAYFKGQGTLTNCTFTGNEITGAFGGGGGGIWFNSGGTVINSTFYNNTTTGQGGGIWVRFNDGDRDMDGVQVSPFILQNSILVGNTAADAALGHQIRVFNTDAAHIVNIQNNLIAGGTGDEDSDAGLVYETPGASGITEENTVDASNASVVFASTDASATVAFLRLATGSPAINAGNNSYIPAGITTDAAGNARIQDGTVDLGAYEGISSVDAGTGTALGIEDAVDDFVLYPNPTSDKLHFSEQIGEFRLYSVEGRLLETWKNVRSADLTKMPSGLYFAEVIRDGRSVHYRIMRK